MYDLFISYAHEDGATAASFQSQVQRLAKPWYKRRRLRAFLDRASLGASGQLTESIRAAIGSSRYLVLLLSPDTNRSKWVAKELEFFLASNPPQKLIVVLCRGRLDTWPEPLRRPEYEDLIYADLTPHLAEDGSIRMESDGVLDTLASIAGPIAGTKPDDLLAADRRLHRRAVRQAQAVGLVLLLACVAAAGLVVWGAGERDERTRVASRLTIVGMQKEIAKLIEERESMTLTTPGAKERTRNWLARAHALRKSRRSMATALDELWAEALPYSEADRLADHGDRLRKLESLEATLAQAPDPATMSASDARELAAFNDRVRAYCETLRDEVSERHTYRFASDELSWRHDALTEVVRSLSAFLETDLGEMELVLEYLNRFETDTVESYRDAWAEAIASIAASPLYSGLTIEPQAGLIPLGEDPDSGLHEFVHYLTNGFGSKPPERDGVGKLAITESSGVILVLLAGGSFWMGAQAQNPKRPAYDPMATLDESPVRSVYLDPFFIAKHELAESLYYGHLPGIGRDILKNYRIDADDVPHMERVPAVGFSYTDVSRWLVTRGLDLPTEPQWEYAARGGGGEPWWTGKEVEAVMANANLADANALAHFYGWPPPLETPSGERFLKRAPVDSMPPNPFGLHHIAGNVSEWCANEYEHFAELDRGIEGGRWSRGLLDGSDRTDVVRGLQRGERTGLAAVRGGHYLSGPRGARSASRDSRFMVGIGTRFIGARPIRRLTGEWSRTVSSAVQLARQELDAGDLAAAAERIRATCERYPIDADAQLLNAQIRIELREWGRARRAAQRAVELAPYSSPAFQAMAEAHQGVGEAEQTEFALSRAIELEPMNASLFQERARVRLARGNLLGAQADFTEQIVLEPLGAVHHMNRGLVCAGRNRFAQALEGLNRAVDLAPEDPLCRSSLARVQSAVGMHVQCLANLEVYVELGGELDAEDLEMYAVSALATEKNDLARVTATTMHDRGEAHRHRALELRAMANYQAGEIADARRDVDGALLSHPDCQAALDLLAHVEAAAQDARSPSDPPSPLAFPAQGSALKDETQDWSRYEEANRARDAADTATAVRLLREFTADAQNEAMGWYALGMALDGAGEHLASVDALSRAIALDPYAVPEFFAMRSMVRLRCGDPESSLVDATYRTHLEPNDSLAWIVRGSIHVQLLRFGPAIDDLTRAIELDDSIGFAYSFRADARERMGQLEGARADRQVLKSLER